MLTSPASSLRCAIEEDDQRADAQSDIFGQDKMHSSDHRAKLSQIEGLASDGAMSNSHFDTDGNIGPGRVLVSKSEDKLKSYGNSPVNDHEKDSKNVTIRRVVWDRRSTPLVAPASMTMSSSSSTHSDAHSLANLLGDVLLINVKARNAPTKQRRAKVIVQSDLALVEPCERALLRIISDFSREKTVCILMKMIVESGNATRSVKEAIKSAQTELVETLGSDRVNPTKVMYIVFAALIACMEHQFAPKYSLAEVKAKYRPIFDSAPRGISLRSNEREWENIHRITNLIDVASSLVSPSTNKTAIFFACTYLGGDGKGYSTGGAMNPKSKRVHDYVLLTECQSKSLKSLHPVTRYLGDRNYSETTTTMPRMKGGRQITRSNIVDSSTQQTAAGNEGGGMRKGKGAGMSKRLGSHRESDDAEASVRYLAKMRRNAKSTSSESDPLPAVRHAPVRLAAKLGIARRRELNNILSSSEEDTFPQGHMALEGNGASFMDASADIPRDKPSPKVSPHSLQSMIGSMGSVLSSPTLIPVPGVDEGLFDDLEHRQLNDMLTIPHPDDLFTGTSSCFGDVTFKLNEK